MSQAMRQALHIFRKDLRHLWPMCGVYVFLLLAFAVAAPMGWPSSGSPDPLVQTAVRLLTYLIPVAIFVLIVRVVHEERLVGIEQFWITRPYRWTSLLIAKCLFILACVLLPFVLMQWWLLSRAGLSLLASSPGMSRSLLTICIDILIPFMLVAAITSTLTEAFMVLTAIIVAWICSLLFLFAKTTNMSPPFSWEILSALFTTLLTGVLIYQYVTRRTSRSRIAFLLIAALFILLLYGFSGAHFGAPVRAMIRSQYPLSSQSPLRLVALPGPISYADREKDMRVPKGFVEIKLPIRLEGLPPDDRLHNTNISLTLDLQGSRYISPWQPANLGYDVLSFVMPQHVFDQAASHDTHLHLEFVAEELRPGASQVVSASDNFSVPGNGRCLLNQGIPTCRYAFHMLAPTQIRASNEHTPCESSISGKPVSTSLRVIPDGGRIDPVIQQEVRFDNNVCPGSQLKFLEYLPADNFRLELDIPSIAIAQYKAH
jgi:hypothetical protein